MGGWGRGWGGAYHAKHQWQVTKIQRDDLGAPTAHGAARPRPARAPRTYSMAMALYVGACGHVLESVNTAGNVRPKMVAEATT